MTKPVWHILGVGAIGSLWACYLHKAGFKVELLLKNQQIMREYKTRGGLTLTGRNVPERLFPEAAVSGERGTPVNNLIVTTKAHQTLKALEACSARLAADCSILLLQNGMGVVERIVECFPGHLLYCGVTTDGAYCSEPFTVVHAGSGRTDIGAYRHHGDPYKLIELLPSGYLDIHPCKDIEVKQWQKLALNCAINGLTVAYHCRNGVLLEQNAARSRMAMLCEEIKRVGIALGYGTWVTDLYQKTENVLRATAANYNSMYQDIEHRRCTEIDYINGYLLQQAKDLGIDCPENKRLYEEIKQIEMDLDCH